MDITPFVGSKDQEAEALDLKTNPLQEGGGDGRGPSTSPSTSLITSPTNKRSRPTTGAMTKKIQED